MRIITGDYRGRRLSTPVGMDVRPTADKVKEAIFNILMSDTYNSIFVDLFAGTGNLGLEALSRGAKRCYFGDYSKDSINLIKNNIKICGAEEKSVVLMGDFTKVLARINEKVDLFLLDPPYRTGLYEKCFELIDTLDLLSDEGIILAEHAAKDHMPESMNSFYKVKEKKYGKIMVSIYMRKPVEEKL